GAPRGIAAAGLAWPQHREWEAGLGEQLRHRAHDLAVALVEGAGAADPVQDAFARCRGLLIGPAGAFHAVEHRHAEPLRPVEAGAPGLAPRIARGLHVAEGDVELLGEAAFLEHEIAADLDDRVHVLDQHRAAFDAPAAGRALPDRLLGDG